VKGIVKQGIWDAGIRISFLCHRLKVFQRIKKTKTKQLKIPIKGKSLVHICSEAIALLKESGFIALEPRFLQRKPDPFPFLTLPSLPPAPTLFPAPSLTHPPYLKFLFHVLKKLITGISRLPHSHIITTLNSVGHAIYMSEEVET